VESMIRMLFCPEDKLLIMSTSKDKVSWSALRGHAALLGQRGSRTRHHMPPHASTHTTTHAHVRTPPLQPAYWAMTHGRGTACKTCGPFGGYEQLGNFSSILPPD
jgi:hypothetical protein